MTKQQAIKWETNMRLPKPKKPKGATKEEVSSWMGRYFLSMNPDIERLKSVSDAVINYMNWKPAVGHNWCIRNIGKQIRYWSDPYDMFKGCKWQSRYLMTDDRVKLVLFWMVHNGVIDWASKEHDDRFIFSEGDRLKIAKGSRYVFFKINKHRHLFKGKTKSNFGKMHSKYDKRSVQKHLWIDNDPEHYYWGDPSNPEQSLTPMPLCAKSVHLRE